MNPIFAGFGALTWQIKLAIIGGLLLLLTITHGSAYFIGYTKGKAISRVAIAEYQTKVSELQSRVDKGQTKINDVIVTKYVDRVNTVKEIEYVNRDVIQDRVISRDTPFSGGWVYAHDQAALGKAIDAAKASNATPSNVNDNQALVTINKNYSIAQQCSAQVAGWNDWYASTKKMYDEYSAKRNAGEKTK